MNVQSTALFVLAHPDDEYGVFPTILTETSAGSPHVVYLTNGGDVVAKQRQAESESVLNDLGVPTVNVHWLGIELAVADGRLQTGAETVLPKLRHLITNLPRLERVYVPAWEGGHPDHDIAHALVLAALNEARNIQIQQFSLYNSAGLPGPLFRAMAPLAANGPSRVQRSSLGHRLHFIRLCTAYPSQWRTWLGLFLPVALKYLFGFGPTLQPVMAERCTSRPHAGQLYYESRGFANYEEIATVVRKLQPQ